MSDFWARYCTLYTMYTILYMLTKARHILCNRSRYDVDPVFMRRFRLFLEQWRPCGELFTRKPPYRMSLCLCRTYCNCSDEEDDMVVEEEPELHRCPFRQAGDPAVLEKSIIIFLFYLILWYVLLYSMITLRTLSQRSKGFKKHVQQHYSHFVRLGILLAVPLLKFCSISFIEKNNCSFLKAPLNKN